MISYKPVFGPSRTDRPRSSSGSDTVLLGFTMNQPVQPNYKIVEPLLRRPGGVPIDLHGGFLVKQPEVRQGGVIERGENDPVVEARADPFGRELNLVAHEIRAGGDVRPESDQISAIHVPYNRAVDRLLPRLTSLKHFYVKPDIEVPFLPHEAADLCHAAPVLVVT